MNTLYVNIMDFDLLISDVFMYFNISNEFRSFCSQTAYEEFVFSPLFYIIGKKCCPRKPQYAKIIQNFFIT